MGDPTLATLRRRLARWRASCRGPSGRIPEALWAAAVERAQREGVERIADALELNAHALRRRVAAGSTGAPAPPPKPVFVELALGAPASPWQLDVESPTGAKLSLRLTGPVPDLPGLLASFLRARA
jgi:hypothetical protein